MTSHDQPDPAPDATPSGSPRPSGGSDASFDGADATSWFEGAAWSEGLTEHQLALQQDLSCLVDGELDETAAAHAMVLLEDSDEARDFFDDIRRFARLHRDLSDPERLEARIAMLGAGEIVRAAEDIDLAHRLATIFYQLGKAYTLAAVEPDAFRERVFEAAVPVHETKTRGRGFVDGVLSNGAADGATRVDWTEARHLLNGRLERIADPIEKGNRLLEQAVEIDPSHEESRIYLAYVHAHEGRPLRAAALYREVFETGMSDANRGHAAMQLGRLHFGEGDHRKALALWRWMTISGLVAREPRFGLALFNIGVAYAALGRDVRALDAFRRLLDLHLAAGADAADVAALFVDNADARELFESRPGFVRDLVERLPELFVGATGEDDSFPAHT